MKEIKISCCCFSNMGTEEVHVNLRDCPIKRRADHRRKDATCYYKSHFEGEVIPKCTYYNGYKKVSNNESNHVVLCSCGEAGENEK